MRRSPDIVGGWTTVSHDRLLPVLAVSLALFAAGCWIHFSLGTYSNDGPQGMPHVSGVDDAYIAYRYGWNLAHFQQLSWNESGFRRTEGFTNPLWVYISAVWALAGQKMLVYPGMVVTSIVLSSVLIMAISALTLKNNRTGRGLMGILIFCGAPVVWLHATAGLESVVFGAVVGLLAYLTIPQHESRGAGFWLGNLLALLAILLRSDGFVYVAVLLLGLLISRRGHMRMVVPGALIGLLLLLAWRQWNFGQLMPNTAVAKLNFGLDARWGSGALLFARSMLNGGVVFLAGGLLGVMAMPRSGRAAALMTLSGWCAYYIYIGGDLFLERHLMAVLFLSAALSGYAFERILEDARGWLLVGLFLIGLFIPFYLRDPRFQYFDPRPRDAWMLIGQEMAQNRPLYGTVVTGAAGKIPFFAGGDFVDELGVNDPELARLRRPDFLPGHSAGSRERALDVARQAGPLHSHIGFNLELTPGNAPDVLLWVDNFSPAAVVNHALTAAQLELLRVANPLAYTLVFRGR